MIVGAMYILGQSNYTQRTVNILFYPFKINLYYFLIFIFIFFTPKLEGEESRDVTYSYSTLIVLLVEIKLEAFCSSNEHTRLVAINSDVRMYM